MKTSVKKQLEPAVQTHLNGIGKSKYPTRIVKNLETVDISMTYLNKHVFPVVTKRVNDICNLCFVNVSEALEEISI